MDAGTFLLIFLGIAFSFIILKDIIKLIDFKIKNDITFKKSVKDINDYIKEDNLNR